MMSFKNLLKRGASALCAITLALGLQGCYLRDQPFETSKAIEPSLFSGKLPESVNIATLDEAGRWLTFVDASGALRNPEKVFRFRLYPAGRGFLIESDVSFMTDGLLTLYTYHYAVLKPNGAFDFYQQDMQTVQAYTGDDQAMVAQYGPMLRTVHRNAGFSKMPVPHFAPRSVEGMVEIYEAMIAAGMEPKPFNIDQMVARNG